MSAALPDCGMCTSHSRLDRFSGESQFLMQWCVCLISFPCDCSVLAEGITQVVSYVLPPTVDACKYARMSGKMTDCIMPLKRFSCNNQSLFTCIRKCLSLALSIRHVGFVQETLRCLQTAQHVNCFWD